MQNYCDIMPQATGWVYIIDGMQSASFYHTYELALEAARTQLATRGGHSSRIFRCQGLDGIMLPIQAMNAAHPGVGPVAYR